jgi:hypothetical protein
MEIILEELLQFTTEKINNLANYNKYNLDFIDKKFLNITYDNKNNIIYIVLFEYDLSEISNIEKEKRTSPELLHITYLLEYNFNFEILFDIKKNIQSNQLSNCANKFREIEIINQGTKLNIVNRYIGLKNDKFDYDRKFKSGITTFYI